MRNSEHVALACVLLLMQCWCRGEGLAKAVCVLPMLPLVAPDGCWCRMLSSCPQHRIRQAYNQLGLFPAPQPVVKNTAIMQDTTLWKQQIGIDVRSWDLPGKGPEGCYPARQHERSLKIRHKTRIELSAIILTTSAPHTHLIEQLLKLSCNYLIRLGEGQ